MNLNRNKTIVGLALVGVLGIALLQWPNNAPKQSAIPLSLPTEPPALPEYKPLAKKESVQLEVEKLKLEKKMKKLMADFHKNLSDRDEQARIEAAMKRYNEEYRKVVLKLAKDELVEENKKALK